MQSNIPPADEESAVKSPERVYANAVSEALMQVVRSNPDQTLDDTPAMMHKLIDLLVVPAQVYARHKLGKPADYVIPHWSIGMTSAYLASVVEVANSLGELSRPAFTSPLDASSLLKQLEDLMGLKDITTPKSASDVAFPHDGP